MHGSSSHSMNRRTLRMDDPGIRRHSVFFRLSRTITRPLATTFLEVRLHCQSPHYSLDTN